MAKLQKSSVFLEERGYSKRVNIIIDETQSVIFSKEYPMGEEPNIQEVLEILQNQ